MPKLSIHKVSVLGLSLLVLLMLFGCGFHLRTEEQNVHLTLPVDSPVMLYELEAPLLQEGTALDTRAPTNLNLKKIHFSTISNSGLSNSNLLRKKLTLNLTYTFSSHHTKTRPNQKPLLSITKTKLNFTQSKPNSLTTCKAAKS